LASSRWAPGAPALADAARAVNAIASGGRSADAALAPYERSPQRAAVRAITTGTIRWYLRLAPAVERLVTRSRTASEVRALLVTGAHQIEYSRNAPEVLVDAAVDAVRIIGAPRASGLVNAVLRRFVRESTALLAEVDRDLPARLAHPRWLVSALESAWPQHWHRILEASNEHPPMTLRVNLSRTSVAQYRAELRAAGMASTELEWLPGALILEQPVPVTQLPGFAEGTVSVQDAGAQLAATLLDAQPGMRVLDACAAPGGKTAHLLERTPGLAEMVAVDIDAGRLERIRENLRRAGTTARLVAADVRHLAETGEGGPYDRILVDAPCSATGVIRRHPDIKLLRRDQDIPAFRQLQVQIALASLRMLAPGGRLLYCTCSLLPEENEKVIEQVLALEAGARPADMPSAPQLAPGSVDRSVGVQLLPGTQASSDGFYYACLEKTTAGTRGSVRDS
jgi:16S rRNA (cytosine967-C5)-methyltransferase